MYSLQESLQRWEDAGGYGTAEERLKRSQLWQSFYSHSAKLQLGTPYRPSDQSQRIANYLVREGILTQTDSVLDIGAGMGGYCIELAKLCDRVTAIDMNRDSLTVLEEHAKQAGCSNINTLTVSWELYEPKEAFDLTFSAMCPAICNEAEIQKLEKMTRRTACILTVARGSYEKCRMELMKLLPIQRPKGMVTELLHYYNVLYLMGRQPNVKCWSEHYETTAPTAALIEQYAPYFEIFGVSRETSVPIMEQFYGQYAKDGLVQDECQMNYALIWWNVP